MDEIKNVAKILKNSKQAVALTGSGISTGSGIPTFRGKDGLWNKYDPEKFTMEYFMKNPKDFWSTAKNLFLPLINAFPSKSHYVLAELEEMGIIKAVITQNIDGLHQKAGSKNVLEIHGNGKKLKCLLCGEEYDIENFIDEINKNNVPLCKKCHSILKPDAVLFGELLPKKTYLNSIYYSYTADVMLVIGTSLLVEPAASLPFSAKEKGAKIITINLEKTPLDDLADYILKGYSDEILDKILNEIKNL
ncbi:MAG: NAD-dependent protein deacylase [Thermoplasmata archaeon]|nr:NAD-dependent protein deacylase [Thermoplasmata archaeon]